MSLNIIHLQSDRGDSGGISNYISLLVTSRTLINIRQKVVVREKNKSCLMLYPNSEIIVLDTDYNFFNLTNKIFKINKILNYENYIIHSHALRTGLLASLMKLFFRKKFLYTNHGLRFTQKKGLKKIYFFLIEILILLLSEKYICIRKTDYYFLKKFLLLYFLKKKIKIIKLRLNINDEFRNLDYSSKFKSPFKIYAIGSIEKVKNPKKFLDWIAILKKYNISYEAFWIGEGKLKNELIKISKEKQLRIKWLGQLQKEKVYEHLSKATFLMQTSLFEVYPTVVLEAFLFGTPVISSSYFGVSELINDFRNGIIIDDIKLDEAKLISIFKNKNKYFLMSKFCRNEFINSHQNHKITAEFYLNIYENLSY